MIKKIMNELLGSKGLIISIPTISNGTYQEQCNQWHSMPWVWSQQLVLRARGTVIFHVLVNLEVEESGNRPFLGFLDSQVACPQYVTC